MKAVASNVKFVFHLIAMVFRGERHEARRKVLRKYYNLLRRYYRRYPSQGIRVLDEEWDYLIILDACRYDHFAQMNTLEGQLEKKISRASNTNEWLRKNFTGYYDDIVYVSGNPRCSDFELSGFKGSDHFYKVENVWKYGWDDNLDTVPPDQITKAALKMKVAYPDKRLIIHYVQPHGPWIGKTKVSVDEIGFDSSLAKFNDRWVVDIMAWHMVEKGQLDIKVLWQATLDNLELALGEVEKLVRELSGKVVVTADHGEAFGDQWVYAHPSGVHIKKLVEVPWLVIDNGPIDRSAMIDRSPVQAEQVDEALEDGVLEDRLRALGYLE